MSIFNNSIWPNKDGQLGETKVAIPDGVTTTWPEGDVLVGDFVFNNDGDLIGLVDSQALIANSSGSTTFPYDYVEINLPSIAEGAMTFNQGEKCKYLIIDGEDLSMFKYKGCKTVNNVKAVDANYLTNDIVNGVWSERLDNLTEGYRMFFQCDNLTSFASDLSSVTNGTYMFSHCTNLESFSSDLSSVTNGNFMFCDCKNLTSFSSDLSSLTDGNRMFYYCDNLTSFSSDLPSLTSGTYMFCDCSNLTSFSSDLPSLTSGNRMFRYCRNLESFTSDLSSLTNGIYMFLYCSGLESFSSDLSSLTEGNQMFHRCTNLTSFSSNLSSLTNGYYMFYNCSNLTTFTSDLTSLTDGRYMFYGCNHLTTFTSDLSSLTYGGGMFESCKLDTASVQNIADTINTVTGNPSITIGVESEDDKQIYFEQMRQKGWDVYVDVNSGSSNCCSSCCATCCYSLTTLDETNGEFVAPKPYWAKPVPATEDTARYIDNDGNYYNILGGDYIYVHDPETYGMFTSLEDAQAQMRLTKFTKGEEPVIIETA